MPDMGEIRAWWQKTISTAFVLSEPPQSVGFVVPPDRSWHQGVRAAEYSAAQLDQINQKLDKLIEAIDRLAEKVVRSLTRLKPRTETDPNTATRNKGWASVHNVAYPIASSAELQLTLLSHHHSSPEHCSAVQTRPPRRILLKPSASSRPS